MELDDLKSAWQSLNARLEKQEALQLRLAKSELAERARRRLRPLARGQAFQMVAGALLALGSAIFWIHHRRAIDLLASGLLMHAYGIALILFGARAQYLIGRIDYSAPVVEIQKRLAELRRFYVRGGLAIGLPWWVLWIPLMNMLFKALFGADLMRNAPEWAYLSLAVGVVGWGLTLLFDRWAQGRPQLAKRLDDAAAGRSLREAQAAVDEIARFEAE